MSQVIKEEGWNQVKSKTKAKAQAMKEQVPEKKSRSGRSITSSVRDSSGCTVRDCKQDAADDKRAKCVVNACRRLQFVNVLIIKYFLIMIITYLIRGLGMCAMFIGTTGAHALSVKETQKRKLL